MLIIFVQESYAVSRPMLKNVVDIGELRLLMLLSYCTDSTIGMCHHYQQCHCRCKCCP